MSKNKLSLGLTFLGLLVLLILSVVFWRERAYFLDASFQCFSLIAEEKYAFQVGRYGAVLVQSLPLLLIKLKLPLEAVVFSYSVSFTLYPLLLFALLVYLKAREYAVMLGLYFLLTMIHTFYWIQSEQIQATALAFVAVGWLVNRRTCKPWVRNVGFTGLAVLTLYTYPLSIAPLLFGMVYASLHEREDRTVSPQTRAVYYLIPVVCALFVIKQFWLNINWYDSDKLNLTDNILQYSGDIFSLASSHQFAGNLTGDYLPLLLTLLGASAYLVAARLWRKLTVLGGAILLWLLIVLTCFHYGPDQYYMESYYLMLGFFLAFPLALDVFPRLSTLGVAFVIGTLIVVRLAMILHVSPRYQARFAYVQAITEQLLTLPDQRYVVEESQLDMSLLKASYDLPTATLMLTAIRDTAQLRTLFPYSGTVPQALMDDHENCFPSGWTCFPYEKFGSRRYFPLTDTSVIAELPTAPPIPPTR